MIAFDSAKAQMGVDGNYLILNRAAVKRFRLNPKRTVSLIETHSGDLFFSPNYCEDGFTPKSIEASDELKIYSSHFTRVLREAFGSFGHLIFDIAFDAKKENGIEWYQIIPANNLTLNTQNNGGL